VVVRECLATRPDGTGGRLRQLASPQLSYDGGLAPSVFICGDDDAAKATIETLVRDLGADPVDAGPLEAARLVEPAMMLVISIAYAGVPRDVGLRLLER
jgi:predicted dinucleotide-binding enzyme